MKSIQLQVYSIPLKNVFLNNLGERFSEIEVQTGNQVDVDTRISQNSYYLLC